MLRNKGKDTFGVASTHRESFASIIQPVLMSVQPTLRTDMTLRRLVPVATLRTWRVVDMRRGVIHDARHRMDAKEHDTCACV